MSIVNPEPVSPFLRGKLTRDAKGKLVEPENVILSLSGAYTQYSILRQDNIARVELFAALEGAAGGNPPYDQDELDANGLGHKANFNDFQFRSYVERGSQAYWNMLNGTQNFIKTWLNANNFAPKQLTRWAQIISRNFSDVMKEWEDFYIGNDLNGMQLAKFGLSHVFWPDERTFMWEVVDVAKFFLPTQTQTLTNKITNCCIESNYTVQQLYQIYTRIGKEKTSNWNADALAGFLIWKANTLLKNNGPLYTDFLQVQRMIDNHDVVATQYFNETVRLVNLYQEEYDGNISHYIFDRDRLATAKFDVGVAIGYGTNDFLFFADRQYEKFSDVICTLTASPGEWTIHGSLGVGQKTFAASQATNMLSCSVHDMALMSSTPLLRTLATGGRDTQPIKFISGVATDIGAAEFVQNNLGANINQLVGASQFLTATIDRNAMNAGDDPAQPDRSQGSISPSEAKSRDFKEFGILKNSAHHFYKQFDLIVRNMFIRLLKTTEGTPGYEYKKEFIDRCEQDGVPPEMLAFGEPGFKGLPKQFRSIKASRIAGDGSNLARIMGLESLQPIAGTFDADELSSYKVEWVEATMGPDYVDTFAGNTDQPDEQEGGASLAAAENFMIQNGVMPTFSLDNEQDAHAITHMKLNIDTTNQLQQQQISPVDADKIFGLSIPHTQQHIAAMERAPLLYKNTLQKLVPTFNQIIKLAKLNRKNAESMVNAAKEKQAKDAQDTQNVMSDAQRKDFVAQTDAQRKDRSQEASIERNKATAQKRGDIMQYTAQQKAENEKLRIQLENGSGGSAKDRTARELESESSQDLTDEAARMEGITPSAVDFETVPPGPAVPDLSKVPL